MPDPSSRRSVAFIALFSAIAGGATVVFVHGWVTGSTGDEERSALARRVEALERAVAAERAPAAAPDRALARRLDAIEARLPPASDPAPEPAPRPAPDSPRDARPPATEHAKLREEVVVGLTLETETDGHRAAVSRLADHLVRSAGPPLSESEFTWAVRLLDRESHRDRITAKEAEALDPVLSALPVGHAARPALAKAVVIGWGRDPRLGGVLSRLGSNSEPALHQAVLRVLDDEHPGAAFSEYVLRLIREEKDPAVLATALGLDIVEAAATAATAPRILQAIEARLMEGDLQAETRTRAGLAMAVAGLKDTTACVPALRRLASREGDAKVARRYSDAAEQLELGGATLKSLERLFE